MIYVLANYYDYEGYSAPHAAFYNFPSAEQLIAADDQINDDNVNALISDRIVWIDTLQAVELIEVEVKE